MPSATYAMIAFDSAMARPSSSSSTGTALVAHGARVTVVSRGTDSLESVRARLGVATICADVTDEIASHRIIAQVRPDILVLNAGATPRMGGLSQLSWADFTAIWETDVKAGLYWVQAALNLPLKPGSRVLLGSSGAGVNGSPLSGGYAGAKRMLWLMANYANDVAKQKNLGIRFQAIVPQHWSGTTTRSATFTIIATSAMSPRTRSLQWRQMINPREKALIMTARESLRRCPAMSVVDPLQALADDRFADNGFTHAGHKFIGVIFGVNAMA